MPPTPRTVIHRSHAALVAQSGDDVGQTVSDGDLIAALSDPGTVLEMVAERPGFWTNPGDWASNWRQLNWHLVALLVAGRLEIERPDVPLAVLGAGGLLWLQPGERHRLRMRAGTMYFLRFRFRCGPVFLAGPRSLMVEEALHLLPFFQLASDDLRFGHQRIGERLRAVLTVVMSDHENRIAADPFPPSARRRLADILNDRRLLLALRPPTLARLAGMPVRSFNRAFHAAYNTSPRRWLADQRLRLAAQHLLIDGQRIEDVATEAGFANPSQFARRFRALFGCSPSAYRERCGS